MPNSSAATRPLILVDGSSYLFRAFHALPALTNSRGQPTGAIYGVISMIKKMLKDEQPEHMAVVFDAKGKTFRDQIYSQYKANRPPMPNELGSQIQPLHDIIRAMGIPELVVSGVEADDVIGTLCRQATEQGIRVLVSTGDKDMAQLVNEHITLVNTMSNTRLDQQAVSDKFGVPPKRIIDYLALMGDKVDNIPGVPGVGPKTAAKWLQEYDSLQGVIDNADKIRGKIGEKLRAALDDLPLSYELATIKCDVELDQSISDLALQTPDLDALARLYKEYDFKTWFGELEQAGEAELSTQENASGGTASNYSMITTQSELDDWLVRLRDAELFAFDTETTDINYMQARIVGMSFAVTSGEAAYLPLAHDYADAPKQLDLEASLEQFKPLLEDSSHAKIGHHLKYDRNVLANHGITLNGIAHDTMLESYVLNSTANRHDLDTLCEQHLQHTNIHFEDVAGKGAKQVRFNQVPLDQATPYAAEDADMVLRLHDLFWPELQKLDSQRQLYESIEIPLIPVLSRIERNGVRIDQAMLEKQGAELRTRLQEIEADAYDQAGGEFNLGSPKQIQEILYEKQGLPVKRKTPKGQPSTAEDVLQELALDYPLPKLILEHRSLSKLISTYIDKLPQQINKSTGRVHTSYHQAVASTGRLSSADPNLQNIPIRSSEGRRIRKAFVAPEGYALLAADYSQIELRIMAHLSEDEGLIQAFEQGLDVHRATASEVFSIPENEVSDDQRRAAKAINFGLIYGMSAFGLARQLNISRNNAQEYVDIYFTRYPGVKHYMDNTREMAREQGYVETLFGRRLYLPEINSRNAPRRQYAERTAINAPMQGTAADIIKRAMLAVDTWLIDEAVDARMIMQVHDELVLEVGEDNKDSVSKKVSALMCAAAEMSVPLEVQAAFGKDWDEAH